MPWDGSKLDDVTRLLIEAREHIERGWCQGRMAHHEAVCIVGAIAPCDDGEAYIRIGRAIGVRINIGEPGDLQPIVNWNDTPGRTKEQVLAAFDRAIAAA